ncbi:GAF domain-containing sensor histidine kinase [Shewanella eurypsychrophilus]|uniref:GAF domain-containing sensor histidine kinase n=1 Tax=Shewanella eurypsychrophilus TaxID=2593656 RepID=A0ABX6VFI3_9GAMM|nr:GAF domain-containing protein [Shewanella sp. YLB-09]QPG60486.1 GAF domain-containing sensor histidine kinase [Shewanella eurypsychrophilus]
MFLSSAEHDFFIDVLNALLENDNDTIPEKIKEALTNYLPIADVQRMAILRLKDGDTFEGGYSVATKGYTPTLIPREGIKTPYVSKISKGQMVCHSGPISDVFTQDEIEMVGMQGIIAHCVLPITVRGKIWGAIASSRYKNHDTWAPVLLERLKALGQILAAAYERYQFWVSIETQNEQLESLSRHLMESQETERRLLSRELHDNYSQRLALLTIKANSVAEVVRESVKPEAIELLNTIQQLAKDMQSLSRSLHPAIIEDLGLNAALKAESRRIAQISELELQTMFADLPRLSNELSLNLYRVLQESLNNVVKHAQASAVFISLEIIKGQLNYQIVDDGIGCKACLEKNRGSIGLVSIRERVQLFNGTVTFISPDEGGFVVDIAIPSIEDHYE